MPPRSLPTPDSVRARPYSAIGHIFYGDYGWNSEIKTTGRRVVDLWFDADDDDTSKHVIYLRIEPYPNPCECPAEARTTYTFHSLDEDDSRPAIERLIRFIFPESCIS